MRVSAVPRRRRPLSLTSLIDVIFLLLLFFMLSSTFTRFGEVPVTGGRTTASAGKPPEVMIRLTESAWTVNGRSFDEASAIGELAKLQRAGARTAILAIRGAVDSQQLVSAVEKIGRESRLAVSVTR